MHNYRSHFPLLGFQDGLVVKNPPANSGDEGDKGLIPGSGRSPGGENGNPLQYSCLGNPIDKGAWGLQSMGSQGVGHNLAADLAHTWRETCHLY